MNCPKCGNERIEETGKFDLTLVDRAEARHDFECRNCGCLFQIIYKPARAMIVGNTNDD